MNKFSHLLSLILSVAVLQPANAQTKPATPVSTAALENPLFRHLPPNAEEVYQVNLPAITAKVSWEEMVSGIPFPQKASDRIEIAILKDPSLAGVDIHQDIFYAVSNKGAFNMVSYTTWLIHLTDSGKFVSFLRSNIKGMKFTRYAGKGRGAAKDKYAAVWNKNLLVVVVATSPKNSDAAPAAADLTALTVKQSLAALQGYDQSKFLTDANFRTGFSDDADLHIWGPQGTSLSTMMDAMKKNSAAAPSMTVSQNIKKTKVLSSVRFGTGSITMSSISTLPVEQNGFYEKYHNRPLNTDLLTHIPRGDLLGFVDLHLDLSAIVDILDKYKGKGKVDSALAKKDLSIDDILHAFKGDFLFTATRPMRDDSTEESIKPTFSFATTIGDPLALMKIAAKLSMLKDSLGKPSETDADNSNPLSKLKTAYTLRDNILVVSSSKELADAWFTAGEKRNTDFITPRMQDNPLTIFVDLKTLAKYLQRVMHTDPASTKNNPVTFLRAFDNLAITAGKISNNQMESYFEIKMTDTSANSLRTLLELIKNMKD